MPDSKSNAETPNSEVIVSAPGGQNAVFSNTAPAAYILGPCAFETRQHALEMANAIKGLSAKLGVGVVYKTSFDKANRTSATSFRGAGIKMAAPVFDEIREDIGLPVLTDVHSPEQCAQVAPHVDILQIPAFLCRQTDLLEAAAATGKAVNVKKGQFLAPWDMKHVVGKLLSFGARDILVTERGASFGYNTLVTDFRGLPELAATGAPVIFDATHSVQQPGGKGAASGGQRDFAPLLARAAAAVGIAGVFIETHQDPETAPSDGPNMIPLAQLDLVLASIKAFDTLRKSMDV
ncbi:MAG: 3-deoxy-8-phosphooctulonate synthase [Pseudomonadota bacterium]